jgi:ferredoxin--NADP+ reductase
MFKDLSALLEARAFRISPHVGEKGDYVIERAFVAR